jgi:transcriptional regulator GlxA family with amidase domain
MVLRVWEDAAFAPPSAADVAMDELVRAIRRDPGNRWTVGALARQAGLSAPQLTRRFRAAVGCPPARFVIQCRLDRARSLLRETGLSVGQVAEALGYEDIFFFSRQYKQFMGQPPTAVRKAAAGMRISAGDKS